MAGRTKTSSFGTAGRESHNSSPFYGRRLYKAKLQNESDAKDCNVVPRDILDKVLCQDARQMAGIPDESIHLVVTSPPYNVGKEYDDDLDLNEYLSLLRTVFSETYRVLVNGGRACVNIANVGRKPYIPYHKFVIDTMEDVGFLMRGEVIWDKGGGAGTSTAWGSWCSPANPTLRDVHEYILLFSKGQFGRTSIEKKPTISRDEFLEFTRSIWSFMPESARRIGHPAPFPVELAYRCIQLYSFSGDVVLDPFCGAGTTCVAAVKTGRHYVGLDISEDYVRSARRRIRAITF